MEREFKHQSAKQVQLFTLNRIIFEIACPPSMFVSNYVETLLDTKTDLTDQFERHCRGD